MSDGDLNLSFGADASGFRVGCEAAAAAIAAIKPEVQALGAAFGSLGGDAQRGLSALTTSVQSQQAAQTSAVRATAAAQQQASDQTTRRLRANNDSTLAGFKATMDRTVASFTLGLLQMAEGSKSFTQVMARVGQ